MTFGTIMHPQYIDSHQIYILLDSLNMPILNFHLGVQLSQIHYSYRLQWIGHIT